MDNREDLGALTGSRASTEPVSAVSALTGFDPARMAAEALERIRDLEPQSYEMPADWGDQMAACAECQRYRDHPIQQGICNEHRQPLWAQQRHDKHEREAIGLRAQRIARDTLYALATEAQRAETSLGSVHEGAGRDSDNAQGTPQ